MAYQASPGVSGKDLQTRAFDSCTNVTLCGRDSMTSGLTLSGSLRRLCIESHWKLYNESLNVMSRD
jgi:hypothetical protein